MLEIEQITSDDFKNQWNEFALSQQTKESFGSFAGSFFQSWEWGEFQVLLGRPILRLAVRDEDKKIIALASFIHYSLPFGKAQIYAPRGPILRQDLWNTKKSQEIFLAILEAIKTARVENNSIFLRTEPSLTAQPDFFKKAGFQPFADDVQPRENQILDLKKSEEELLSEMHPSARHNIRLAKKRGVIIRELTQKSENDQKIFFDLMKKTLQRQRFRSQPKQYYNLMLDFFQRRGENQNRQSVKIAFFEAIWNGKTVAANIVFLFGSHATYLFGGSDLAFSGIKAPILLHWESMLRLKKDGYLSYDLGGISRQKWPGLTDFKTRFGGQTIKLIGSYDFVFSPFWYYIYKYGRRLKRSL
ncbi:MAG: peptidoglycan bridge formation glycyltransferase FemA/FemB family protein [Parcubacteria group bacterium]|nr:peptidoglycan bridge formation glycyltransferase FemA/FemB family protein [Parcubacteria group bacterium]